MKNLNLIFSVFAAVCLFVACENLDEKTEVLGLDSVGYVNIEYLEYENSIKLSWEKPRYFTTIGTAVVADNQEYDVNILKENGEMLFIKTVDAEYAILSESELQDVINGNLMQEFVFAVSMHGLYSGTDIICYSSSFVPSENNNQENYGNQAVDFEFVDYNRWFVLGSVDSDDTQETDFVRIIIPENVSNHWDVSFCNIFSELGQMPGDRFSMSFDVMWNGASDYALINIVTGCGRDVSWQWSSEENTELEFEDGFWSGFAQEFKIANGELTHIEWGGTVGQAGMEQIGIQMNMATNKWSSGEEIKPNTGVFYIANMSVSIGERYMTWWTNSE